MTGDRKQPGRSPRLVLKPRGRPPDIEEHVAHEIFGGAGISGEAQDEAIDAHAVTSIQRLHGGPVAVRDPLDERLVGCVSPVRGTIETGLLRSAWMTFEKSNSVTVCVRMTIPQVMVNDVFLVPA